MRITPLDVRKQEFNKSMRGFDCDEVQAFLSTLADEYETVLIDNKQIRERVMEQDEKIGGYQEMERTLRDTLMTAERVMQDTRETAGREGEVIIQEAQLKAKQILEECRLRTEELRREIIGLRKEKETYLARFRGLAEAQIQFVDTHVSDFDDLDKRLVNIVDNVVTSTISTEEKTVPTPIPTPAPVAQTNNEIKLDIAGPEVAPSIPNAPAASEHDIWRDYDSGQKAATPAAAEEAVAGSIADIVSESLAETSDEDTEIAIPMEALQIDVISNGQAEDSEEGVKNDTHQTETLNV